MGTPGTGGFLIGSISYDDVQVLVCQSVSFRIVMNLVRMSGTTSSIAYRLGLSMRFLLGRQQCLAFGNAAIKREAAIEHIFVINLDRQQKRLRRINDELQSVLDASGLPLWHRTTRVSAVDACEHPDYSREGLVEPTYTLGEQLFVDPHPFALPDRLDLDERIDMTPEEVAVACSHVKVWREIASGPYEYALVLEDDVWFHPRFARVLDKAWSELRAARNYGPLFDLLYLSYREVDYGAEKIRVSPSLFSPFRGLWYLSGYVLSRTGAEKLLRACPVRGPADLWMNHQFGRLKVVATVKSIIGQRHDQKSNNSYSVIPILSRVGIMNSETPGLFRGRPPAVPVFAFGSKGSGLSSLAMALSMLGYRCCSDVDRLPRGEMQRLLQRHSDRIFDAYVNVADLRNYAEPLAALYPHGRLILTVDGSTIDREEERRLDTRHDSLDKAYTASICQSCRGIDLWRERCLLLPSTALGIWKLLCGFLRCVPPPSAYPHLEDIGHRPLDDSADDTSPETLGRNRNLQFDHSPWVAAPHRFWRGVPSAPNSPAKDEGIASFAIVNDLRKLDLSSWMLRSDTFPGNLALFRPSNFVTNDCGPARLVLRQEDLGVRKYSSAALSSRRSFLYGHFEAVLKPSSAAGVVTGMFLQRDSPRQEIDIEFLGNRPQQILTNVYYNPGIDGARFDYGYRGTPILIDLDFDTTDDFHCYAIEWSPTYMRWYVDGRLVHQRCNWAPTPIPHLPMQFHLNLWPPRSRELAGKMRVRNLPAICGLESVRLAPSSVVHT